MNIEDLLCISPNEHARIHRLTMSEETKDKIRKSMMGNQHAKGYVMTEEQKRHLSEINTGKKLSEETKKKIGDAFRGRTVSEETRDKMRKMKNTLGKHWKLVDGKRIYY